MGSMVEFGTDLPAAARAGLAGHRYLRARYGLAEATWKDGKLVVLLPPLVRPDALSPADLHRLETLARALEADARETLRTAEAGKGKRGKGKRGSRLA